jgi:hypothetical protein
VKFKTKINTNELFQFLMKHSYAGISGKIGLLISLVAAILFIKNVPYFIGNEMQVILFGILALLFTVVNPLLLLMKAKQQKLTNPAYKNEMEYELNEEGIVLHVGEQEGGIPWDMIVKIVETKSLYLLYTTRINAFLWPKKDMGAKEKEMIDYLLAHIDASKVRLPKRMRG